MYDEIDERTRNFHPVFIKDYERHLNPRLKKYQYLFIDHINEETLDKSRNEYLNNIKKKLDEPDDTDDEEIYFNHNI